MAHRRTTIKTQRVVPAELLSLNHEQEGDHFSLTDTVFVNGRYYLILRAERTRGPFHLRVTSYREGDTLAGAYAPEVHGAYYRPPHPSMTAEDIEGADYAWDDGSHWHFAHCSPHEQVDFASLVRTFTEQQFSLPLTKAEIKVQEATNAVAKAAAVARVRALVSFATAAGLAAYNNVVNATLGHFHRDPHHDHRRDLAVDALDTVLADWNERGRNDKALRSDATAVSNTVAAIRAALSTEHTIEWRAAREKRLNDAAAARGEDPIAGFEYCYAARTSGDTITGDSNLPDPNWNFDQLADGPLTRGSIIYTDGEPTAPWVVRFRRPIPEGTVAGASIGSVTWEQESAYNPG